MLHSKAVEIRAYMATCEFSGIILCNMLAYVCDALNVSYLAL